MNLYVVVSKLAGEENRTYVVKYDKTVVVAEVVIHGIDHCCFTFKLYVLFAVK